jgi:hypothetical protein
VRYSSNLTIPVNVSAKSSDQVSAVLSSLGIPKSRDTCKTSMPDPTTLAAAVQWTGKSRGRSMIRTLLPICDTCLAYANACLHMMIFRVRGRAVPVPASSSKYRYVVDR